MKKVLFFCLFALTLVCATAQNRLNDVLIFNEFVQIRNFFVTNTSRDNNIGLLVNNTPEWNDTNFFLYQIDTALNIIHKDSFEDPLCFYGARYWAFCGYNNGTYFGFAEYMSDESVPIEEPPYWSVKAELYLMKKRQGVDTMDSILVIQNITTKDSSVQIPLDPIMTCNGEFLIYGTNPEGNFNLMLVDTNGQITATNQIAVHNENVFFKTMGDSLGYLAVSTEDSKTIYGVNLTTLAITDTLVYIKQGRLTDFIIGKTKEIITV